MKQRVVNLLRGSTANYAASWLGFTLAIILSLLAPTFVGMDPTERGFFYVSLLFSIAQCFTLSKTLRDRDMADVLRIPMLKGTSLWLLQVVVSLLIATIFSFYAVLNCVKEDALTGETGLAVLAVMFALTSTTNLAKSVRDKADAEMFSMDSGALREAFNVDNLTIEQICELVKRASRPNVVVAGTSFAFALVGTLVGVFSTSMQIERKGYFLMAIIFMTASSFHLAKLIRDKNAVKEGQNVIAPHESFTALVVISWLLSVGLAFGGLQVMKNLDKMHRTFVLTGMAYILASVINLAKSVRDQQEMRGILLAGDGGGERQPSVPLAAAAVADHLRLPA